MYEVTVELKFEAAHRLLAYQGKCKHLHGHSYRARIAVCSTDLQPDGFVVDFGVLKSVVGGWIDENWDHTVLLFVNDPICFALHNQDVKICMMKENPTAEYMARHLYEIASAQLCHIESFKITAVTIQETVTSWATYTPDFKGEHLGC